MTTICFRDGIMAADRATYLGGDWRCPARATKIMRLRDGSLFAGAGEVGVFLKLREWLDLPLPRRGKRPEIPECDVLVAALDGCLLLYTGSGVREVEAPFTAIGSGAPVAFGAMYHGASAEEAVRIAALVDPWTGDEVQIEHVRPVNA